MNPATVAETLAQSRKYRHLSADTLLRIAAWAVARSRTEREASERARRKLHQVYGAYLEGWDPVRAERILETAAGDAKAIAGRILRMHASTRERLPVLEGFYASVFELTGVPQRVVDLGCGLHPLALPWMGLPADAEYRAWDIDRRLVAVVNRWLGLAGRPPLAECRDALTALPDGPADVAFLLKMLPCLEQQEAGCSPRLLREIRARHVVVSFPTRSIGGRSKGMAPRYAEIMDETLARAGLAARRLEAGNELVFVVDRRGP